MNLSEKLRPYVSYATPAIYTFVGLFFVWTIGMLFYYEYEQYVKRHRVEQSNILSSRTLPYSKDQIYLEDEVPLERIILVDERTNR